MLSILKISSRTGVDFNVIKAIQRPKLVVGIVVDQMRWDYLNHFMTDSKKTEVLSGCFPGDLTVKILISTIPPHLPLFLLSVL